MAKLAPRIPPLSWVRPPVQTRSQQTLQRLLDAAEAMINEHGIDNVTVQQIAKRAGSSVGAFYARFKDKEALLRSVFDRFTHESAATVNDIFTPERWAGVEAATVLETIIRFTLRVFHDRGGLVAAYTARAARDPELTSIGEQLGEQIADLIYALLEQRGEQLEHPEPKKAVRLMVWLVLSAFEARSQHAPRARDLIGPIPEHEVAAEITRMCVNYLGLRTGASRC